MIPEVVELGGHSNPDVTVVLRTESRALLGLQTARQDVRFVLVEQLEELSRAAAMASQEVTLRRLDRRRQLRATDVAWLWFGLHEQFNGLPDVAESEAQQPNLRLVDHGLIHCVADPSPPGLKADNGKEVTGAMNDPTVG